MFHSLLFKFNCIYCNFLIFLIYYVYISTFLNLTVFFFLKSDNMLVGSNGSIKLADFGYSAQLTQKKNKRNTVIEEKNQILKFKFKFNLFF